MNKVELIAKVAVRAGLGKGEAVRAVEAMLTVITEAVRMGDDVRLVNFGCFSMARRKESIGRNPRTGESIDIPSTVHVRFKPGQKLKDL